VLGAGTMGAQVAAHVAGQGLEVVLLDIPSPAPDRSAVARNGLETLRKRKPSPLHLLENLAAIRVGNFEDDQSLLADADWVFEAVVEDLEVKRQLFARIAPAVKKTAIVSSNTSGLGIAAMTSQLPVELRRRFLGTHFFNPPRYLKLLETIPGPETEAPVLAAIEAFCDQWLGKGVVRCKDTPNFIANRIGSYAFGAALQAMQELDLTIEEVDTLTGPAIGRAKSATFRTADIAGVDIAVGVAAHLYDAVPNDPERSLFRVPDFMRQMVERKWLGEKTGVGFYKKDGKEIRALDWKTLEHRERQKPQLASLEAAQSVADIGARLNQVLAGQDKAAQFLDRVLTSTCLYAAALVPEIADDVVSVDRAMEWGYGWGGRAVSGRRAIGPAPRRDAPGVGPEALLRDGRREDHGLRSGRERTSARPARRPRPRRPQAARRPAQEEPGGQPGRPGRRLRASRVPLQDEHPRRRCLRHAGGRDQGGAGPLRRPGDR